MKDEMDTQGFLETQIEALVNANIDPAKIYATAMTDGLMPTDENLENISKKDLDEWDAHFRRFGYRMSGVKKLISKAKKNPEYTPEDEQYIAGAFFASLISGIALGTEIEDYPEGQQDLYNKVMWIYDNIHQYEMKYHPLEMKKRMKLI